MVMITGNQPQRFVPSPRCRRSHKTLGECVHCKDDRDLVYSLHGKYICRECAEEIYLGVIRIESVCIGAGNGHQVGNADDEMSAWQEIAVRDMEGRW